MRLVIHQLSSYPSDIVPLGLSCDVPLPVSLIGVAETCLLGPDGIVANLIGLGLDSLLSTPGGNPKAGIFPICSSAP